MTTTCATGCTRPVRDNQRICDECGTDLEQALGDVTAHHADLEATLAKQRAIGDRNDGGRSAEHPLPIHVGAMRARSALRAVLAGWVRDIAEAHGGDLPAEDEPAMSRWLLARRATLLTHPAAEEIHHEVTKAVRRIERIVDRPPELELVGRCDAEDGVCGAVRQSNDVSPGGRASLRYAREAHSGLQPRNSTHQEAS